MSSISRFAYRRLGRYRLLCSIMIGLIVAGVLQSVRSAENPPPANTEGPDPDSVTRVIFVPEIVKKRIREEIKNKVLEEARRENWAAPNQIPDWLSKIVIGGDLRCRYEMIDFAHGNANSGEYPDFHAINTGKPFDVNFIDIANERYLNVDRDRGRVRYQARIHLDAKLSRFVQAGLRFASGSDASPVSTNQSLGTNFGKYHFWIDQAYLRFMPAISESLEMVLDLGRLAIPFMKTDLTWDHDVNLDGIALNGRIRLGAGLVPFFTAGAFLLQTTSIDYPAELTAKYPRRDKWLYVGQLGIDVDLIDWLELKFAASYYHFDSIQGRGSGPCNTHLKDTTCDTDSFRPGFAQKGNTYMALRVPSDTALLAEATSFVPRYQYFGLASAFRELAATLEIDIGISANLELRLEGEYVQNIDLKRREVSKVALNNWAVCDQEGNCERFAGGNEGFLAKIIFASRSHEKRWDWNIGAGYRYIESDAALDAYTNSDIGMGGTNQEGYVIEGEIAIAENVWLGACFLSSDNIVGPPLKMDILQIDITGRF